MKLSLIIPTHKRPEILRECLRRIERQTIVDQLEVIVVSDGQDEETSRVFETMAKGEWQRANENRNSQFPTSPLGLRGAGAIRNSSLRFLEIPPCHQGVARNRGVQAATADLCLFLGDDIFLEPDACEKHLEARASCEGQVAKGLPLAIRNSQFAILGFTTWDPTLEITEMMRWLETSGWQFGYPMIEKFSHQFLPSNIQHLFTYTSHISLPTAVAKQFPFREDVTLYGWEDIEWGLRLAKAGIRLFYEPDAKAFHHHPMTLEDSLKRMETLGRSAVEIEKIVPELNVVPKGWKKIAYALASKFPTMRGRHARAFLRGTERSSGHR